MWASYRAELFKTRKRAAVWVIFAAGLALSLIFSYLLPYLGYATGDENPQSAGVPPEQLLASVLPDATVANAIGGFPIFAGALALVLGALVIGGEYGWGTLKTIFTQRPGRLQVLAAQLLALATMLAFWELIILVASALSGVGIALAEGEPISWPGAGDAARGLAAGWLVLMVWCLAGVALAIACRSVAVPIGLGVVWVLGVENLVSAMARGALPALEPVANLLPGANAGSLVYAVSRSVAGDPPPGVSDAVGGGRALLTLCCYAAVLALAAAATLRRRDVV